jgi:hypothetical protein
VGLNRNLLEMLTFQVGTQNEAGFKKSKFLPPRWWLKPVVLATQETAIRRIKV